MKIFSHVFDHINQLVKQGFPLTDKSSADIASRKQMFKLPKFVQEREWGLMQW
jgi:hypothetical protein